MRTAVRSPRDALSLSPRSPPFDAVRMSLTFAHTSSYPDELPLLRVRSVRGVSDSDVSALQRLLESQASADAGSAVLFTLYQSAREWLREKAHFVSPLDADEASQKKAAAEAAEEARRLAARAAGTPVNSQTYAVWLARFLAETAPKAEAEGEKAKRLTGKRWFEQRREGDGEGEAEGEEVDEAEEFAEDGQEELDDEQEEESDAEEEEEMVQAAERLGT